MNELKLIGIMSLSINIVKYSSTVLLAKHNIIRHQLLFCTLVMFLMITAM